MANQGHVDILKQGVDTWNKWRRKYPDIRPDLSGIDLSGADLRFADLSVTDLNRVGFFGATLIRANLREANLYYADFGGAALEGAPWGYVTSLEYANLTEANLSYAQLQSTNLSHTKLSKASFYFARMGGTMLSDIDLREVKGLNTVEHGGPSSIGLDTIYLSKGNIPEVFLKGAGIDDTFITYIHSLVNSPIEYYSCFISYSSKDEPFATRLYADLQNNNVRCWFAPEDLRIGDKFWHRIDESIHIYDKLLLVLSEASLASTWVGYEVEKALDKEPEGKQNVLFPIRLDKAILTCETDWAKNIRKSRHIGDFEHWKDHDAYQVAFERLLRDLKAQS